MGNEAGRPFQFDPAEWPESDSWLTRARRLGPIPYSELGPRRLPAPTHVDPLAAWMVDALDQWWEAAGRPDPYTLVVVSGDDGTLARRVLEIGPVCLDALRYVVVHPQAGPLRVPPPAALLPLEEPAFLFPSRALLAAGEGDLFEEDPEDGPPPATGVGPLVTFLTDLPVLSDQSPGGAPGPVGAVVLVETLSRLPTTQLERSEDGWCEVRVAAAEAGLVEVVVPVPTDWPRFRPEGGRPGERFAILSGATQWLRRAIGGAPAGVVAVVDRWVPESGPVAPGAVPPLALDQLQRVRRPDQVAPHVIDDLRSVVTWRIG